MKNLGLYNNDLSIPRKQDLDDFMKFPEIQEYVEAYTANNYVTKEEMVTFVNATVQIKLQSTKPDSQNSGDFWYKIKS